MPNRAEPGTDLMRPFFDTFFERLGSTAFRMPETDVSETENSIHVTMDLPGLRPEDINVDLENNVLTVSGEKREEHEVDKEESRYHLAERRWGQFTRSFVLPREVEATRINASYDNGVLKISIPKSESARRRRISVQPGEQGGHSISAGTTRHEHESSGRGSKHA